MIIDFFARIACFKFHDQFVTFVFRRTFVYDLSCAIIKELVYTFTTKCSVQGRHINRKNES